MMRTIGHDIEYIGVSGLYYLTRRVFTDSNGNIHYGRGTTQYSIDTGLNRLQGIRPKCSAAMAAYTAPR